MSNVFAGLAFGISLALYFIIMRLKKDLRLLQRAYENLTLDFVVHEISHGGSKYE